MLFLICLDPLLNKRVKGSYQEHANEEVYIELNLFRLSSNRLSHVINILVAIELFILT